MNTVKQTRITMKRGEILRFSGGSLHVVCQSGSAWITAAQDLQDYAVSAGAVLDFEQKESIVIQGLTDGIMLEIKSCA